MNQPQTDGTLLPNGPAAAAIVSAGAGCFAMGALYVLGSASAAANHWLSMYGPAGALSGAAAATCVVWLATWAILHWLWRGRTVAANTVCTLSLLLLAGGLLLTFPPIARLF